MENGQFYPWETNRDPWIQNLQWYDSFYLSRRILNERIGSHKPFGLEVGFGNEPTIVPRLDHTIDWYLTEIDEEMFSAARHDLPQIWEGFHPKEFPSYFEMNALHLQPTPKQVRTASILVFRNLDLEDTRLFPAYEELRPGQRLIFMVNGYRSLFNRDYIRFLINRGYNPAQVQRSVNLNHLCRPDFVSHVLNQDLLLDIRAGL